ncbi:hypothetical protein [Mycolicibacterium conceptionense]|uniref:hypothetical protein n=1 Tax=Mycolicibacterium conceptionense TaxID=451644 RepID=UPI0013F62FDC|nr:hypothetical protein [Mycolicibacterium conceptionense]
MTVSECNDELAPDDELMSAIDELLLNAVVVSVTGAHLLNESNDQNLWMSLGEGA